jgi:acyl carrier protein
VLPDAQLRDLGIDSLDLTEIAAGVDEDFDVEVNWWTSVASERFATQST